MDGNAFGQLVRAYRNQRGWKQEELAARWGVSREYISLIERGRRKLEKQEQVNRLADILGIPEERLSAIGKGMPRRKPNPNLVESDDVLLQALLEPAQDTIKMSWLIWRGDSMIVDVETGLQDLEVRLTEALGLYRGQFHKPALRLLAYTHEMLGKLAVEHVATQKATMHFQEMYDIADELSDTDMLTLAMIHQAEMLRRRGRYEASSRRLDAIAKHIKDSSEKYAQDVSGWLQGVFWKTCARNSYVDGNEYRFESAIDKAAAIAEETHKTIDTVTNEIDPVDVMQERAHGYTMLWKPEKALEIYQETDQLRPFRPLRDQASYTIVKAQAHCYVGDFQKGVEYALAGLKMAESFHSVRYVIRLRQMSDRLNVTPLGTSRSMQQLRGEIFETLRRMNQ